AKGGTLTLGGGNNGNGIARILDKNNNEIILMNKDGIELAGGANIIGEFGVVSSFVFISDGEYSGWQLLRNNQNAEDESFLFSYIPQDFEITEAKLYTYAMPIHFIDNNPQQPEDRWDQASIRLKKYNQPEKGYGLSP